MSLHTIKEVAEALNMKTPTIRHHVREKNIKAKKYGRKWMVTGKELDRIISGGF